MSNSSGDPLNQLMDELAQGSLSFSRLIETLRHELSERRLQSIDKQLAAIIETLTDVRYRVDPAKHDVISITLGRPDALSRFFAFNFTERPRLDFASVAEGRFYGSGAYALYYIGKDIEPYQSLSNSETPIYVGKAVPARPTAETAFDQGPAIWKRLKEHQKSIRSGGLDPADFHYRYAVIQSGMESAVEDFMIRLFKPIWNKEIKVCFGIGKHGDSANTRKNRRSPWDTMHPGRPWADATTRDQSSRSAIIRGISNHLVENPPIADKASMYRLLAM